MKRLSILLVTFFLALTATAQEKAAIDICSHETAGMIDPMLYGQLFEHIYFSANNGVWQELIYERSFEPEHYPGITPRDGYFDGWFMDEEDVLHSPTRYEQPLKIVSLETDDYEITAVPTGWPGVPGAAVSWTSASPSETRLPASLTMCARIIRTTKCAPSPRPRPRPRSRRPTWPGRSGRHRPSPRNPISP